MKERAASSERVLKYGTDEGQRWGVTWHIAWIMNEVLHSNSKARRARPTEESKEECNQNILFNSRKFISTLFYMPAPFSIQHYCSCRSSLSFLFKILTFFVQESTLTSTYSLLTSTSVERHRMGILKVTMIIIITWSEEYCKMWVFEWIDNSSNTMRETYLR